MTRVPAMLLASLAVGAVASSAQAARVLPTDLDGLVERSAMVFEGRVQSVDIAAGDAEPRTRVTVQLDTVFAGDAPGSTLTFELPMGVMADGTILDIAEAPRFMPGTSYLVFFKRGSWRITPVAGWDQGYFRLVDSTRGPVFASASGHCVTGVGAAGFALGPRVARPAMMPGFGEPVKVSVGPAVQPSATCLPADVVRDDLNKALTTRVVPPDMTWNARPTGSILRHDLVPDTSRLGEGLQPTGAALCGPSNPAACMSGGDL